MKRLNARYDWLNGHWAQKSYRLKDGGDGCSPTSSVAGAVAWVTDSGCSFFTKVCDTNTICIMNARLFLLKPDKNAKRDCTVKL